MEQETLFKGRDKRKKGWFWMDNDYLNGYAKYFGAVGTAIYVSLCRHADNETQKCFPAQETIAEELGIVARTVRKYLGIFEQYKIISIEREKDSRTKKWLNNVYTLLDKDCWLRPGATVAYGKTTGNKQQKPEATGDKSQRQQLPNKETHINKTHIKETHIKEATLVLRDNLNPLIELFKQVNPSYQKLFANKTQRAALDRLVKQHGFYKIKWAIEVLPKTNRTKYAPTICTPLQLEEKLGNLIAFVQKERSEIAAKKIIKI